MISYYRNLSTTPTSHPAHTQPPPNHYLKWGGTGLSQDASHWDLHKKGEKCAMGQSLKGLPPAEQRLPVEVGLVAGWWVLRWENHPILWCFWWHKLTRTNVFYWFTQGWWNTPPDPPNSHFQVARLPQRKALPRGGASVPGGDGMVILKPAGMILFHLEPSTACFLTLRDQLKHSWLENGPFKEDVFCVEKCENGDIPASYVSLLEGKIDVKWPTNWFGESTDWKLSILFNGIRQGSLNVTHFRGRSNLDVICCW